MDQIIFASYLLSLSAITVNMIRAKLQDDLEAEMKEYREYDLSYEKINFETGAILPTKKYIVLANHKAKKNQESSGEVEEKKKTEEVAAKPLFVHTVPYANILDPARYF